ncbi:MAG TPA: Sua5/YciO/YrdC/YwlC family protein, partial [Candidatus Limnocylindrales bacterium]|nr:Sua5/YciO/YrdC/YwlC family protein [Candidatus Limnocylindrales bacterium]
MNEIRAENLSDAVTALRGGDVIVFPTETLYGLGADALNFTAVEKVFQLKGRDPSQPFPVLVSDRSMLESLVGQIVPLAEKLMARFWPGPLTLVLPARPDIPKP